MLKKALSQLNTAYDFCVIDNPPALNVAVANSLAASNKIIICSSAEAFALDGLMELSATIDDIHQFMNPSLIIDGILITIFNHRTIIGQHIKEQLSPYLYGRLFWRYLNSLDAVTMDARKKLPLSIAVINNQTI